MIHLAVGRGQFEEGKADIWVLASDNGGKEGRVADRKACQGGVLNRAGYWHLLKIFYTLQIEAFDLASIQR